MSHQALRVNSNSEATLASMLSTPPTDNAYIEKTAGGWGPRAPSAQAPETLAYGAHMPADTTFSTTTTAAYYDAGTRLHYTWYAAAFTQIPSSGGVISARPATSATLSLPITPEAYRNTWSSTFLINGAGTWLLMTSLIGGYNVLTARADAMRLYSTTRGFMGPRYRMGQQDRPAGMYIFIFTTTGPETFAFRAWPTFAGNTNIAAPKNQQTLAFQITQIG